MRGHGDRLNNPLQSRKPKSLFTDGIKKAQELNLKKINVWKMTDGWWNAKEPKMHNGLIELRLADVCCMRAFVSSERKLISVHRGSTY